MNFNYLFTANHFFKSLLRLFKDKSLPQPCTSQVLYPVHVKSSIQPIAIPIAPEGYSLGAVKTTIALVGALTAFIKASTAPIVVLTAFVQASTLLIGTITVSVPVLTISVGVSIALIGAVIEPVGASAISISGQMSSGLLIKLMNRKSSGKNAAFVPSMFSILSIQQVIYCRSI